MGVDHRGQHILVTEQFLNRSGIVAVGQQMRGETVPEAVTADRLVNPGQHDGLFKRLADAAFMQVMAAGFAGPRFLAQ